MRKYWYRRFLLVLLVLSILGYAGYEITKRQEQGRKKEVSADTVSSDTVIPGGMPVGIYLENDRTGQASCESRGLYSGM